VAQPSGGIDARLGRYRLGSLLLAAFVLVLAAAAPARATFPGANGRIAYSQADLVPLIGGETGDLSAHSQVFTIEPDGSGRARLTHVAGDQAAGSPEWSPDGDRIVYESNESGSFQVWVMDADGGNQTQLTDDPDFEGFQPSFSPDGQSIVFSRCASPLGFMAFCDIAVMDADGDNLQTILSDGHWSNVRPGYSPDGDQISFSSSRGGLQSAVWVMDADGSDPERLTPPRLRAMWPDWAPDGEHILFGDNCCVRHSNLWTVEPDGSDLDQITHVPKRADINFPTYSPNGKRIVAFDPAGCDGPDCDLLVTLRADGTGIHRLKAGTRNAFLSDWGPG
jgi:Tol biopolymer transport system component